MSGPISPLPPPSPSSSSSDGSVFTPSTEGLSGASSLSEEEEQDIQDLLQLSSLRGFQRNDGITINQFQSRQIDALLELIEVLKESEQQGNENFWLAFKLLNVGTAAFRNELEFAYNEHEAILTQVESSVNDLNNGQSDVTDATNTYGTEQDNIVTSQPEDDLNNAIDTFNTEIANGTPYATAVVALNAAIQQYNDDISAYNTAAQEFNNEIDDYNALIASYNANAQQINDVINPERATLGVPELEGVPFFSQIPETYKVPLIDTVDLLDTVVQEPAPPHQTINAPERDPLIDNTSALIAAADAIGTTNVSPPTTGVADDLEAAITEYNTSLSQVREKANTLNEIIAEMEQVESEGGDLTDLATQYNASLTDYNNAVISYNNKRSALQTLISTYNGHISDYNTAFQETLDNPDVYFPPAGFGSLSPADLLDSPSLAIQPPIDLSAIVIPSSISTGSLSSYPTGIDYNVNGNIFSVSLETYLSVFKDLIDTLYDSNSTTLSLIDLINLFSDDKILLSVILMKRGQVTSEEFTPQISKTSTGSTSPSATSLANLVFGLGSSALTNALDNANLSKQFSNIFEKLNQEVPRALLGNITQVLFSSLLNSGIFNIKPSTQLALDLSLQKGIESVPVTLALNIGLVQTLSDAVSSGEVRDALGTIIAATGGLGQLSPLQRDNLISSLTNLSIFALLGTGIGDLASATQNREVILGNLAQNLAFGLSGTPLDLREQLKSVREYLGKQKTQQLQDSVTKAFIAALQNSGTPSDKAAILGKKIADGVFSGENPTPTLLQEAGANTASVLSTILLLAIFNPDQIVNETQNAFNLAQTEAGKKALEGIGLTEQDKENLLNTIDEKKYFLEIVAELFPGLGSADIKTIYNTLSSVQITSSVEEKLSGEIGKSQAQILAKRALNSINSVENILRGVLQKEIKNENFDDVDRLTTTFKDTIKFKTNPATFLTEFLSPAKNWLRFSGMVQTGEGLPQSIGGTLSGVAKGGLDIAV